MPEPGTSPAGPEVTAGLDTPAVACWGGRPDALRGAGRRSTTGRDRRTRLLSGSGSPSWACCAPGARAVDLGAGTGQVTGPLLAAGLDVVAVEPGPTLAAELRERSRRRAVVVARAEEAELAEASFDIAVAATSMHWMDLGVLLPRLHRALVADGRLLVWRNVFGDPEAPSPRSGKRVHEIVARRGRPTASGQPRGRGRHRCPAVGAGSVHGRGDQPVPLEHRARRRRRRGAVPHVQRLVGGRGGGSGRRGPRARRLRRRALRLVADRGAPGRRRRHSPR